MTALWFAAIWAGPALCDYLVERGDTLSVSVAGEPDYSREVAVDSQGRIAFPDIGPIDVAGLSVDATREAIINLLTENDILLSPSVIVEIARYRPLYVDGAVGSSGPVEYSPGLTVRHAILLAGGVTQSEDVGKLSVSDLLEFNAEWRTLGFSMLEVNSRIARIRAELANSAVLDLPEDQPQGAEGGAEDQLLSLDASILSDRVKQYEVEEAHRRDLLDLVEFEISVLTEQQDYQENEQNLQATEVENSRALVEKGLMPAPRLRELERERSRLARDLLEVRSYSARVLQTRETLEYEAASARRERQIKLREDLRTSVLEQRTLQSQIDLLSATLVSAGLSINASTGITKRQPDFTIYRLTPEGEVTLTADMATLVLPGDVLEVKFSEAPGG